MLSSFAEFKFFNSFRIPIEKSDNLRFLVEKEDDIGNIVYIDDASIVDVSITGFGFETIERLSVGTFLSISLQFKKIHLDLTGKVVRSFCNSIEDDNIIYGVEIDQEPKLKNFLETLVFSFSGDRLKNCLIKSALKENYTKATDGFEVFSLFLSLFKDITQYGHKEGFVESMLDEVVRLMNAQRASIFLINPISNQLEAIAAIGIKKDELKFDYRLGVAGSVFTTGVALNLDTQNENNFHNKVFDVKFNYKTESIICHPIHNREDKIIGVIEVLNKKNEDRFTVSDEKTMKVLTLVFSAVFNSFSPHVEHSLIRSFSNPYDRKFALIGNSNHIQSLRSSIDKLKNLSSSLFIEGEKGVGKKLFVNILHNEGQRGLGELSIIDCKCSDEDIIHEYLFGDSSAIIKSQGGTVYFEDIDRLSHSMQDKLLKVLKNQRIDNRIELIDVRVIASSNYNMGEIIDKGDFNQNLFELISEASVKIHPLRRHMEDLKLLVDFFILQECKKEGLLVKKTTPKFIKKLEYYDWPNNVDELKKAIKRAIIYNPKNHLLSDIKLNNDDDSLLNTTVKSKLPLSLPLVADFHISLKERVAIMERELILSEIKRNYGNKSLSAKVMGISREALRKKLLFSARILKKYEKEIEEKNTEDMICINNKQYDKDQDKDQDKDAA